MNKTLEQTKTKSEVFHFTYAESPNESTDLIVFSPRRM